MKRLAILVLVGVIFAQRTPIYLRADSLEVKKVLRLVDDSTGGDVSFVQMARYPVVKVVLADSLCDSFRCFPTNIETLIVVLQPGESTNVFWRGRTTKVVSSPKNTHWINLPCIDPNGMELDGDEIFLWNSFTGVYRDSAERPDGGKFSYFKGTERTVEFFVPESVGNSLVLHRSRHRMPNPSDTFACSYGRKAIPIPSTTVEQNGLPLYDFWAGGNLPVNVLDPPGKIPLLFQRFEPDSFITIDRPETVILPIFSIDASWLVRWKWLWDRAEEYGDYSGYISYLDEVEWGGIFTEGIFYRTNRSAPAQFSPDDSLATVDSILAILENDGIANDSLLIHDGDMLRWVRLKQIFWRDYDTTWRSCEQVFSRPVDSVFGNAGSFCDNARKMFRCRNYHSCDSTGTILWQRIPGTLVADYLLFEKYFTFSELLASGQIPYPLDLIRSGMISLVLYIIADGSVPRLWVNESLYITSPDYFPVWGNPYGFVRRGFRIELNNPPFNLDGMNRIAVEHISPNGAFLGAQVIFAIKIIIPHRREFVNVIVPNDTITIPRAVLRGTATADSGNITDTAFIPSVDTLSAITVWHRENNIWKSSSFTLSDSTLIIIFDDTLQTSTLWRWFWFK